jgi:hypothetical protein
MFPTGRRSSTDASEELLASSQVDGPALTASVTPTSILSAESKITIPGAGPFLYRVGQVLRIRAHGRVSNIVTTPGTLTLDVRFGPTSNIVIANGGAIALNVVAKANVPWVLDWQLELRSVGSGTLAKFHHQGSWVSESVVGSPLPSAGGAGMAMLPNAAPAVGTGFDSNSDGILDLFATWSLNNANSIQTHGFAAWLSN